MTTINIDNMDQQSVQKYEELKCKVNNFLSELRKSDNQVEIKEQFINDLIDIF